MLYQHSTSLAHCLRVDPRHVALWELLNPECHVFIQQFIQQVWSIWQNRGARCQHGIGSRFIVRAYFVRLDAVFVAASTENVEDNLLVQWYQLDRSIALCSLLIERAHGKPLVVFAP